MVPTIMSVTRTLRIQNLLQRVGVMDAAIVHDEHTAVIRENTHFRYLSMISSD